ncbi:hypothetical protein [Allorhodopirellula solitaria]|uniref:Uncharacterized protein n=1 Tax=Allorhodopirellula solitaria TaxID=2527987 RepID=A0A5C5WYY6_9BACT|nr:hypothetical protein [Allorhodopirellula solitaria]TWT55489.1 hypothetical protein CA85_49020 [Allorhodopirellula solitaria]
MRNQIGEIASKLGVEQAKLEGVAVLVLPEKVDSEEINEVCDAHDSVLLAKQLKQAGIPCRTAYDLGVEPRVLDRRGADVWLGMLWLFLENTALPATVDCICDWVSEKRNAEHDDSADKETRIHVELRMQRKNNTSTIKFDGSVDEFREVMKTVKKIGAWKK